MIFGLSAFSAFAQRDSSFQLIRSYRGDIVDAAMDHLENIYLISSTGGIKKFSASGDSLAMYNQVRNYGQPYSIDVSNPLKIVLFYKDFSTIVLLDRFLAVRGTIDLRRLGLLQPGAAGLAYDNNIWVFDEYDSRLRKLDEQGNILVETPDFRAVFNGSIQPQRIISNNNMVYLADSAQGIFAFDNYGTFKRKIPVQHWKSLALFRDRIIATGGDFILLYDPSTFTERRYTVPSFQPYFHSFTASNRFVVVGNDGLRIYGFNY
jgi:hypothetical protein